MGVIQRYLQNQNQGILEEILAQGENQRVEFKSGKVRSESVARELVAFLNTFGGILFIGVSDDGSL